MKLVINGEVSEFPGDGVSVQQLLAQLDLGYPVLVELNGEALFKRELDGRQLADGDQLELMRMVAGG